MARSGLIQMPELEQFLAALDANRLRRAKELSDIKSYFGGPPITSPYGVHAKAAIVLCYAHWEGFYNECVNDYITCLGKLGNKVGDVAWSMLVGVLTSELKRLRDKNLSHAAQSDFVEKLRAITQCGFEDFDTSVVAARSNLNFDKLRDNFRVLGFDISKYQEWRLSIDKELVGWRHSVAHGDSPDLSSLDLRKHVVLTQNLMLMLADSFQDAISEAAALGTAETA